LILKGKANVENILANLFLLFITNCVFFSIWSELTINCKREEENKETNEDNRESNKRTEEEAENVRFNF
jgi:hypothetical protein